MNENIKKYRINKGLTQQDIADKLFVTRQCISRWEQGKSVPDLDTLKKLAEILGVTISEIIDNESIKTITINEAVKNQKAQKFIWTSLIISTMTIILVIGFIVKNYFFEVQNNEIYQISGIILDLTSSNSAFQFESKGNTYNFTLSDNVVFLNNILDDITLQDLKVGDIVKIEYKNVLNSANLLKITVIDSKVDKSLLGVVVDANSEDYLTYDDIMNNEKYGVRFALFKRTKLGSQEANNAGDFEYTSKITNNGYYHHYNFEMNVYFDPLKIKNEIKVGLVYSTGIEYVDIIDPKSSTSKTYVGEMDYETFDPYFEHSIDVTYKINFIPLYSFYTIEVFEYDHNNALIKSSIFKTESDYYWFNGDDSAIYSYVKVNSQERFAMISRTYKLMLGDRLDIVTSDEYGLTWKDYFYFSNFVFNN